MPDQTQDAETLHELGLEALNRDQNDQAEKLFRESLEINEFENGSPSDLYLAQRTYNNLGIIEARRGNTDEAIGFYQLSIEICESIGEDLGIGTLNLANVLASSNDPDTNRIMGLYNFAAQMGADSSNLQVEFLGWLGVANTCARIQHSENYIRPLQTFETFEIARNLANESDDPLMWMSYLSSMGDYYLRKGNTFESKELHSKAEEHYRDYVRTNALTDKPLPQWYIDCGFTDPDEEWDFPPPLPETDAPDSH